MEQLLTITNNPQQSAAELHIITLSSCTIQSSSLNRPQKQPLCPELQVPPHKGDKIQERDQVSWPWCPVNNLDLNVSKVKELTVGLRKRGVEDNPVLIHRVATQMVDSFNSPAT